MKSNHCSKPNTDEDFQNNLHQTFEFYHRNI